MMLSSNVFKGSIFRPHPEGGHGNPFQYLLGDFHGQRSLAGYSPWSNKQLDMNEVTEQLLISLRSLNSVSLGPSRVPGSFRRIMA